MLKVTSPVLLPKPGSHIIEADESAAKCVHEWRVPNLEVIWDSHPVPPGSFGLGLLLWLLTTIAAVLALSKPRSRRARMASFALVSVAILTLLGGDIWRLIEIESTVSRLRNMFPLTAIRVQYEVRLEKAGIAWHMAAAVIYFGGAAVWFAWTLRLPDGDADLDEYFKSAAD